MTDTEIVLISLLGSILCPSFVVFLFSSFMPDKKIVVLKGFYFLSIGKKYYKVYGYDELFVYVSKNDFIVRYPRSSVYGSCDLYDEKKIYCFKIDEL